MLCKGVNLSVFLFILQSRLSIVFWNSLREWLPDDRQRLELGLKLELFRLTNGLQRFYLLRKPRWICVEFEFFLGPLKRRNWEECQGDIKPHPPDCGQTLFNIVINQRWRRTWKLLLCSRPTGPATGLSLNKADQCIALSAFTQRNH